MAVDDDEVAALKARLAALESGRSSSMTPANAGKGLGCVGTMAIVLFGIFALMVVAGLGAGGDSERAAKGQGSASDYIPACAAGLVQLTHHAPAASAYHLIGDAMVLDATERNVRVQCPLASAGGRMGVVVVNITCGSSDPLDCTHVSAGALNGHIVYP